MEPEQTNATSGESTTTICTTTTPITSSSSSTSSPFSFSFLIDRNVCMGLLSTLSSKVNFRSWSKSERAECLKHINEFAGTPPRFTRALWYVVAEIFLLSTHKKIQEATANEVLYDIWSVLRQNASPKLICSLIKAKKLLNPSIPQDTKNAQTNKTDSEALLPDVDSQSDSNAISDESLRDILHNVDSFFCSIIDVIAVIESICNKEQRTALASVIHQINSNEWLPPVLIVEHLSNELIDKAFVAIGHSCNRMENRNIAIQTYTVPQVSLACEELEGFMNLTYLLTHVSTSSLPESWFSFFHFDQVFNSSELSSKKFTQNSPESLNKILHASDFVHFAFVIDDLWKKIEKIIVTYKILMLRVIEMIIRAFSTCAVTHWPVFVALLKRAKFRELSPLFGFLLSNLGEKCFSEVPLCWTVQNTNIPHQNRDSAFLQIDKTLTVTKDIGIPSLLKNATFNVNLKDKLHDKTERDWVAVCSLLDRELNRCGNFSDTLNLNVMSAILVRFNLIDLEILLDHMPSNLHMYRPCYVKPQIYNSDSTIDLFEQPTEFTTSDIDSFSDSEPMYDFKTTSPQVNLLSSLLLIGDWNSAMRLMSAYSDIEWCIVFPRLTHCFIRILQWVLSKPKNDNQKLTVSSLSFSSSPLSSSSSSSSKKRSRPRSSNNSSSSNPQKPLSSGKEKSCLREPTSCINPLPSTQHFFFPCWTSQFSRGDTETAEQLLAIIGHALYLSDSCAITLCDFISYNSEAFNIKKILTGYLFPALLLNPAPSLCLNESVWYLISDWSISNRYSLYEHIQKQNSITEAASESDLLSRMNDHLNYVTRYWLKRVSKDTIKPYSRKFAKIALRSPLILLQQVVQTVMTYENMTVLLVECLRYLDEMSCDMLLFVILKAIDKQVKLCGPMKPDGQNLETWLLNISRFLALLLRNQKEIDIAPLLTFLDHPEFGFTESQILSDLITELTGIKSVLDIPVEQIRCIECKDSVARRTLIPALSSTSSSNTMSIDELGKVNTRFIKSMKSGAKHLRFMNHMRNFYSSLGVSTNWNEYEVVEKSNSNSLLNDIIWRDRMKSLFFQYLMFMRLFCGEPITIRNYEAIPYLPKMTERFAAGSQRHLFWTFSHYHLYFKPELYNTTTDAQEAEDCELHRHDYEKANTKIINTAKALAQSTNTENENENRIEINAPIFKMDVKTQELFLRTLASPWDALYVALWIRHPAHAAAFPAVSEDIVRHVWALGGMTETEASQFGHLLYEALKNVSLHAEFCEFVCRSLSREQSENSVIRNTLQVLKMITAVFPQDTVHFTNIRNALEPLRNDPALRVMVIVVDGGLDATLKRSEREKQIPPEKQSEENETTITSRKRTISMASEQQASLTSQHVKSTNGNTDSQIQDPVSVIPNKRLKVNGS